MRRVRGTAAGRKPQSRLTGRFYVAWLAFMAIGLLAAVGFASTQAETAATPAGATSPGGILAGGVLLLEPLMGSKFNFGEKFFLCLNVVIALGGLGYALSLVKQVKNAPEGTKKMQEIAAAIREGANAYLYRQFRVVGVLIVRDHGRVVLRRQGRPVSRMRFVGAGPSPSSSARSSRPRWASSACGWPRSAISAWPRPPGPASARPCNSAIAPARSPAC